ncbi:hypothetical protein [Neokomagataea anthophila]|uniref:Uncharacterized protein n=1 Tax=Neokomagataea anthophila TaxID=2826925 RepID=A0ABS5E7Y6_9PROT|nr:hypothetical protein [Neokomagataea anthophila]MBR0559986.1 hypothetical protein [Neokomagataea anthophila]
MMHGVKVYELRAGSICPAMLLPCSGRIPDLDVVKGILMGVVIGAQCLCVLQLLQHRAMIQKQVTPH